VTYATATRSSVTVDCINNNK